MTDESGEPGQPSQDRDPHPPASELDPRPEPLFFRLARATFAPPVLKDGGHDAPLSARGRIIFWTIVIALSVAIAILLVASLRR